MKKVAILTQPLGHNYGGIIQNFALQHVLKELGFEPITIDRCYKKSSLKGRLKTKLYHLIKNTGKRSLSEPILRNVVFKNNYGFIQKYINTSKSIFSDRKLKQYAEVNSFYAYIVGSDQTWRPKYSPNIYNYFLDFLVSKEKNVRYVAYACSFGTNRWEYTDEQTQTVLRLVKQFDSISVREDAAVDLCRDYLNINAIHTLDPTLLLSKGDYIKLLNLQVQPEYNKSLYTYILDQSDDKEQFLRKCASLLGMNLFSTQARRNRNDYRKNDVLDDFISPRLEDWLAGFMNSGFVLTDSFHGVVFSIIFNKPFIAIVNTDRGASRFTSLLNQLGLAERMVSSMDDFNYEMLHEPINYQNVADRIETQKHISMDFLLNSLK